MLHKFQVATIYDYGNYNNNNPLHIYYSPQQGIASEEINKIVKPISDLTASSQVSDTDAVYFHTSSMIPRYKFSKFCEGKKTRRVINLDKATACVVNLEVIKQGVKDIRNSSPGVYYEIPISILDFSKLPTRTSTRPDSNLPIYISTKNYVQARKLIPQLPEPSKLNKVSYEVFYRGAEAINKLAEGSREVEQLLQRGIKLVSDDILNRQMADGGLVITEDNFEEFQLMLASKDKSVVDTAMELLANSDYILSPFYIGLLLNRYRNVAIQYINKGVNIKNFFEFFKDIHWNKERHRFLKSLRDQLKNTDQLDEQKERFIRTELLNYANDTLAHAGIKVAQIFYNDEKIEVPNYEHKASTQEVDDLDDE
jgi:hypothetical protein